MYNNYIDNTSFTNILAIYNKSICICIVIDNRDKYIKVSI